MRRVGYCFHFEGRVGRLAYLRGPIPALVMAAFVLWVEVLVRTDDGRSGPMEWLGVLIRGLAAITVLISQISFVVRRLHDLDRGAWHLAWLLPVCAAWIVAGEVWVAPAARFALCLPFFWLSLRAGTAGANRFGSAP